MEKTEVVNIRIPVYLNPLYVSSKHVERVELLLEVYPNLGSFFNAVCADAVARLIEDGSIKDYVVDANDTDDEIVSNKLRRSFNENIDNKVFGHRLLEEVGYNSTELKIKLKTVAFYLIEASLATVHDYIFDEAAERGKRVQSITALSVINELGDNEYNLPTRLTVEVSFNLDYFRRIQ